MKDVEFSELSPSTSIEAIEGIEKLLGLKLPEEYCNHLLEYNGGRCSPAVFSFVERGKITESEVDWFLGIHEEEYDNLGEYIDSMKVQEKRMPSQIVPIANDPGGNLICISCGEKDYGKVYFWDHELEVDYSVSGDEDYSNLHLIANSFGEFLEGLH